MGGGGRAVGRDGKGCRVNDVDHASTDSIVQELFQSWSVGISMRIGSVEKGF